MEGLLVVALAMCVQRWWVPRLRTPTLDLGEPPPDFRGLGSPTNLLLAAGFAALAATAMPPGFGAWSGYAVLGAALVVVDLRTTYLPNQLMTPLWWAVGAGLGVDWLVRGTPPTAAVLGAAAAYACFWLVWRTSRSFGFGDVRLAAAVGAVAGADGAQAWATSLVAGTALGAVAAIVATTTGRRHVAYGPWLWLGPVVARWLTPGS